MFRNLAANLITHERIVTTDAKAKELRRVAERLITKAKRLGPIAHTPQSALSEMDRAKRLAVVRDLGAFLPRFGVQSDSETRCDLVEKVMVNLSKRFADRPGGYTRIVKLGRRRGDSAPMSIIEFVDRPEMAAVAPIEAEPEAKAEEAPKAE
jgi:large subunit ribosomal protein L17